MTKAAVDIGTNSVRLLIVDGDGRDIGRWQRVTGLGRAAGADGELADESITRTVLVLNEYADLLSRHSVESWRAVATAAARDASNRDLFVEQANRALGRTIEVISGHDEARLSFAGATRGLDPAGCLVVDIGGGSTEFADATFTSSVPIGSVRLTEMMKWEHPVEFGRLEEASRMLENAFADLELSRNVDTVIGVAGTWTSLAGIHLGSAELATEVGLTREDVDRLVARLAALSLDETARLVGLDPARAPVILAGAMVARESMRVLGVNKVVVSGHDLLDGLVASLA